MAAPLTPEGFGRFLRWLSANDETAVREYQRVRAKLVRYFTQKGCSDPDALFDKTVDIIVGKIQACEECPYPVAYCYGVAKNVWRQYLRGPKSAPLVDNMVDKRNPYPDGKEQELKCLERCVNRLSSNDRDTITKYYQGQGHDKIETRKLLAEEHGGANALRIRMCRIRKELRACVIECTQHLIN
jgi:DNA-directed RNA polymerase specialized sigma24 family protein